MDDYKGQLEYTVFNRLLDRWPYQAPIKGGFTAARWTTVVILTNIPPISWYPPHKYDEEIVDAVLRRVGCGKWEGKDPDRVFKLIKTREEMEAFNQRGSPPDSPTSSPDASPRLAPAPPPSESQIIDKDFQPLPLLSTPSFTVIDD